MDFSSSDSIILLFEGNSRDCFFLRFAFALPLLFENKKQVIENANKIRNIVTEKKMFILDFIGNKCTKKQWIRKIITFFLIS